MNKFTHTLLATACTLIPCLANAQNNKSDIIPPRIQDEALLDSTVSILDDGNNYKIIFQYQFNDDGTKTVFEITDGEITKTTNYDAEGKTTKTIVNPFLYLNGERVNYCRYYSYDNPDCDFAENTYLISNNDTIPYRFKTYTFDKETGEVITEIIKDYDSNGAFYLATKNENIIYDVWGNTISGTKSIYSVEDGQETIRYMELTKDENGKPKSSNFYIHGVLFYKYTYGYDDNGNATSYTMRLSRSGVMELYERGECTYDDQNRLLSQSYFIRENNAWVLLDKDEYTYDNENRVILHNIYKNNNDGQLVNKEVSNFTYDESGNITHIETVYENYIYNTSSKTNYYHYYSTYSDKLTSIPSIRPSHTDDAIYSLEGTRLTSIPEKGLYIKNGKKYIAK